MASLEAENRSGLAFRVCLRMNTNACLLLKGVKGSLDMIEKPKEIFVCVFVRV